ncbi:MAG: M28 family peptidase [Deltaproteobacteria bacterium]|nr:M28 family peptidase [Deltaproteobacteria bacterium]
MFKRVIFILAVAFVGIGCAGQYPAPGGDIQKAVAQDDGGSVDLAAASIEEDFLREAVAYIASDELEGRGPGTRGDRLTRKYLAGRLEELGYEPAGNDGGWEQRFSIVGMTSHMPKTWTFKTAGDKSESFSSVNEYMVNAGVQRPSVSIADAELVFVGFGISAPEEKWDDYKDADLKGKILLILNDDPDWDPDLFGGERKLYYGRWTYKYENAARAGASGAIIIHTTPSAGYSWEVIKSSNSGPQFEIPAEDEPRIQMHAWMTEAASKRLVAVAGKSLDELVSLAKSRDFRPVPLGIATSISFDVAIENTETANIAGILKGSDPALGDQVVVFSAHHDHLGIGDPDETGDRIYNGALDNGVAMAQALGVAKAFAALTEPPRRSILILFVGGEEQGLLGSRHFATNPTVPLSSIAANINFELGNVWGRTRDVTVYGKGKSNLEDMLETRAKEQGRNLTAEKDPRAGWYYRSDQFSFARAGVPAIWFKSGVDFIGREKGWGEARANEWIAKRYHRPSDELEDGWDFSGLVEDARLAFLLGFDIANTDQMPAFYPGDEFAAKR